MTMPAGHPGPVDIDALISHTHMRCVLAFGAHPDDLDFGAAATIAALTARGIPVTLCLITDGDAGGFSGEYDAEAMAVCRREEQHAAAAELGVESTIFLGERDGYVESNHDLIKSMVRVIRTVKPDLIMGQHPERAWDRLQKSHPDHLASGEALVRACYPAVENPYAYPELLQDEGLEAFYVRWLLLMAAPQNYDLMTLDVTGYESAKMAALQRHVSQHPDPDRMTQYVLEQMRALHHRAGASGAFRHGTSAGRAESAELPGYAEEFHLVEVNGPATIAGF